MTQTVIREVVAGIWTFSRPFSRLGFVPIGGRSTVVKLQDNSLFVIASTPLDEPTLLKLKELGEIKYLVAPDAQHHRYLTDYTSKFPNAKVIGVAALIETMGKKVKFDSAYGHSSANTKYGFEDEIDTCYFDKFINKDVAFLHRPSKTLMVADLIFNLPGKEQHSKSHFLNKASNYILHFGPYTLFHKWFLRAASRDDDEMRRDALTVANWDFNKIIPCHGDVIEQNGNAAWREAYEWYLR